MKRLFLVLLAVAGLACGLRAAGPTPINGSYVTKMLRSSYATFFSLPPITNVYEGDRFLVLKSTVDYPAGVYYRSGMVWLISMELPGTNSTRALELSGLSSTNPVVSRFTMRSNAIYWSNRIVTRLTNIMTRTLASYAQTNYVIAHDTALSNILTATIMTQTRRGISTLSNRLTTLSNQTYAEDASLSGRITTLSNRQGVASNRLAANVATMGARATNYTVVRAAAASNRTTWVSNTLALSVSSHAAGLTNILNGRVVILSNRIGVVSNRLSLQMATNVRRMSNAVTLRATSLSNSLSTRITGVTQGLASALATQYTNSTNYSRYQATRLSNILSPHIYFTGTYSTNYTASRVSTLSQHAYSNMGRLATAATDYVDGRVTYLEGRIVGVSNHLALQILTLSNRISTASNRAVSNTAFRVTSLSNWTGGRVTYLEGRIEAVSNVVRSNQSATLVTLSNRIGVASNRLAADTATRALAGSNYTRARVTYLSNRVTVLSNRVGVVSNVLGAAFVGATNLGVAKVTALSNTLAGAIQQQGAATSNFTRSSTTGLSNTLTGVIFQQALASSNYTRQRTSVLSNRVGVISNRAYSNTSMRVTSLSNWTLAGSPLATTNFVKAATNKYAGHATNIARALDAYVTNQSSFKLSSSNISRSIAAVATNTVHGAVTNWTKTYVVAGKTFYTNNLHVAIDRGFPVDIQRYGFLNLTQTALHLNTNTMVFTLSNKSAGGWSYYRNGLKWTVTSNRTVTVPAVSGLHFIYIDTTNGTLTESQTPLTLNDTKLPVAYVAYSNNQTPKVMLGEERHQCLIDRRVHRLMHSVDGTELISAGVLSGPGTLAIDTNKFFGISATTIADEDLFMTLDPIARQVNTNTNTYVIMHRTGTGGTWSWTNSKMPFYYTAATRMQYDASGVMTPLAVNSYMNYYLIANNFFGKARFVLVPGRTSYSSAANAYTEDFKTFDMTGFPLTEGAVIYQMTWTTAAGGGRGLNHFVSAQSMRGNIVSTAVSASTPHNLLTGLQGGTNEEYYHLTAARYNMLPSLASTNWTQSYVAGATNAIKTQLTNYSPFFLPVRTMTNDLTVDRTMHVLLFSSNSAQSNTAALPAAAACPGKVYIFKKTGVAGKLIIDPNSTEKIEGAIRWVLYQQFDTVRIVSDGTAWWIIP